MRGAVLVLVVGGTLGLLGCRPAAEQSAPARAAGDVALPAAPDLATARVIDLSHPYDESTIYWPTSPSRFERDVLAEGMTPGGFFYAAGTIHTPEHGGTHLDAPYHFDAEGWTTAEIPLDRLVGPAVVVDVREATAADPDHRLTVQELERWERRHGRIPEGAAVLLRTGWDRYWPDGARYLGGAPDGDASDLHFPSYGEEAARWLIEERRVAALGVDTASIDYGPSQDFPVHRIAGAANVPGLENLTQLARLPPTGAWIVALPMKIAGGSGGPLRVIALVADEEDPATPAAGPPEE